MNQNTLPPVILLMGPTASGKTELAVRIAQKFDCEIISVDSAMVYRGMDIGTAKPAVEERKGINHHLIDILDASESFSTAQFRNTALALMENISKKGKIPLLAGGTMLYFNSLINGLAQLPDAENAIRLQLDREAKQYGWEQLHRRLQTVDPESAGRIHPNDPQRIQRALEVYEITGKPLSRHLQEAEMQHLPFRTLQILLAPQNRADLHAKIALRFNKMLEQGFIEEVEKLYFRGDLSEKHPSIRCVGYRQIWAFLAGEYNKDTMAEKAIAATRQLAKRQFTWLRKLGGNEASFSDPVGEEKQIIRKIEQFIR